MQGNFWEKIFRVVCRIFFIVGFFIIFLLTATILLFSHDIWLLIIGVVNNYPQVYFDIFEDHLWWNIVDICARFYSSYFWFSNRLLTINSNVTCVIYITLNRAVDFLYATFWLLWVTKWDLYYACEIFVLCLDATNTLIVAPFLLIIYIHWFSSHILYAILAFSCNCAVTILFDDPDLIRSLFDNDFINNNLRWYLPLFVLIIAALVLIRSSTPRYRYDYLSKIGWLKFFGISLGVVLIVVLIYFFW